VLRIWFLESKRLKEKIFLDKKGLCKRRLVLKDCPPKKGSRTSPPRRYRVSCHKRADHLKMELI
jgi:hypothetical protein